MVGVAVTKEGKTGGHGLWEADQELGFFKGVKFVKLLESPRDG